MLMPSNNMSGIVHYFAGRYPGRVGLLYTPGKGWRTPPYYLPYAIDNGAFTEFKQADFLAVLDKARMVHPPLWVLVPDVVGDAEATMKLWHEWEPMFRGFWAFRLAFACQDGMEPQDVPKEAYACFIGGSTEFKLSQAHRFKGVRPWLHIGRVNQPGRIRWAKEIGADSIDGTGFFRSGPKRALIEYFEGDLNASIFSE